MSLASQSASPNRSTWSPSVPSAAHRSSPPPTSSRSPSTPAGPQDGHSFDPPDVGAGRGCATFDPSRACIVRHATACWAPPPRRRATGADGPGRSSRDAGRSRAGWLQGPPTSDPPARQLSLPSRAIGDRAKSQSRIRRTQTSTADDQLIPQGVDHVIPHPVLGVMVQSITS